MTRNVTSSKFVYNVQEAKGKGMDDEMLDAVDGHDRIIGKLNRKDFKQFFEAKKGFIRAAELFVMNDQGKLWVPIRTAHKTIAPNGYDFSVAGHVGSGQDYLEAVIREAEEEADLRVTPDDLEFVAKLKWPAIRCICSVYLLRANQTPRLNPDDFTRAEWLDPSELLANIDKGHPAKDDLRDTVVALQAYLAHI